MGRRPLTMVGQYTGSASLAEFPLCVGLRVLGLEEYAQTTAVAHARRLV